MPGGMNSRVLGIAPATLFEYLEGESSEKGHIQQRVFNNDVGRQVLAMSHACVFQTIKRGEIHELKEELYTNDKAKP